MADLQTTLYQQCAYETSNYENNSIDAIIVTFVYCQRYILTTVHMWRLFGHKKTEFELN